LKVCRPCLTISLTVRLEPWFHIKQELRSHIWQEPWFHIGKEQRLYVKQELRLHIWQELWFHIRQEPLLHIKQEGLCFHIKQELCRLTITYMARTAVSCKTRTAARECRNGSCWGISRSCVGERGLGWVVHIPSGCVAKINIP
jgi:hypothetical protein